MDSELIVVTGDASRQLFDFVVGTLMEKMPSAACGLDVAFYQFADTREFVRDIQGAISDHPRDSTTSKRELIVLPSAHLNEMDVGSYVKPGRQGETRAIGVIIDQTCWVDRHPVDSQLGPALQCLLESRVPVAVLTHDAGSLPAPVVSRMTSLYHHHLPDDGPKGRVIQVQQEF